MPDWPGEEDGRAHIDTLIDSTKQRRKSNYTYPMVPATTPSPKMAATVLTKSNSLPSTPVPRPHSPPAGRHSPKSHHPTRETSPRSVYSAANRTPPASRRPGGSCKYETALTQAYRRVVYTVGSDKLEPAPKDASKKLGNEEETILTNKITALYTELLPTAESENRRERLILKLETLLRARWPGQQIKVSVFGSTGNKLGTKDSDVDLCITTDCKEIEHVCSIAELFAKNGMQNVVCVSSAKVPIVRGWDPELQVACDANVNNPHALENTAMIRSYVEIDDRFRPLAMIVKYWAKRRILNDAALGGTLSSYTWICLVLNFLQTRDPPILPSLQKKSGITPNFLNGVNIAFDKDLDKYRDFGKRNTSTLGQLLFQFFHYYGHELDFETAVMSVRLGKVIKKTEKAWHLLHQNRLCVEEPFNVSRNLGNTADDTSMRGIHLELRRAFDLVVAGKFDECCEQYILEQQEQTPRPSGPFIPQPTRAIIPQAPPVLQHATVRAARNGPKGNRNSHRHGGGGGGAGRRASNPAGRGSTHLRDLPFAMTPQELQLQAQHQQHLLHDQLFQQYQYLQMQEQELRMQLYRQRGLMATHGYTPSAMSTADSTDDSQEQMMSRSSTSSRVPMTAPLYQQRFVQSGLQTPGGLSSSGIITNPGSPLMLSAVPDTRRYARRASTNNLAQNSLRAHSQPARIVPMMSGLQQIPQGAGFVPGGDDSRRSSIASSQKDATTLLLSQQAQMQRTLYDAGRRPVEYVGYYLGQTPSLPVWSRSAGVSPISSAAGLAIHHGGLSPQLQHREPYAPSVTGTQPMRAGSLSTVLTNSLHQEQHVPSIRPRPENSPSSRRQGPPMVDGSLNSPPQRSSIVNGSQVSPPQGAGVNINGTPHTKDDANDSIATSEDIIVTTPSGSEDMSSAQNSVHVLESFNDLTIRDDLEDTERTTQPVDDVEMMRKEFSNGTFHAVQHEKSPLSHIGSNAFQDNTAVEDAHKAAKGEAHHSGAVRRSNGAERELAMPLGPVTNGQVAPGSLAMHSDPPSLVNGWQLQSKKKRKNRQSQSSLAEGGFNMVGGEIPPADDSLRKGG